MITAILITYSIEILSNKSEVLLEKSKIFEKYFFLDRFSKRKYSFSAQELHLRGIQILWQMFAKNL